MNMFTELALAIVPAVLAITLHEAAHGYAALALGDTTAKDAGRLSLNPLRHVDRAGRRRLRPDAARRQGTRPSPFLSLRL